MPLGFGRLTTQNGPTKVSQVCHSMAFGASILELDARENMTNTLFCKNATQWRAWLNKNGGKVTDIWLVFDKGRSAEQSLTYGEALDEALCYGWIDSLIKRLSDQQYARKFSRRRDTSKWSLINKGRVGRLTREGRMKPQGIRVVREAKANGMWDKPDRPSVQTRIPAPLHKALASNKDARVYFSGLSASYRRQYVMWIVKARKQETIERRVNEALTMLKQKKTLGLK